MDANGQKFSLLSSASHWQLLNQPSGLEYHHDRRSLRLARMRRDVSFVDDSVLATERLLITPQTLDSFGNRASLDSVENRIVGHSDLLGQSEIFNPEDENAAITDMVMAHDDVLYIAIDGQIVMHDRRERWAEQNINVPALADFSAWRMASDPRGGIWVIDRDNKKLARVTGMPLHKLAVNMPTTEYAKECIGNPNPPQLTLLSKVVWPDDETPVAIACNQQGEIAILCWVTGEDACIYLLNDQFELSKPMRLSGSPNPYSLKWVNNERIAILLAGINNEAPAYRIDRTLLIDESDETAIIPNSPVGDLYPLKNDFDGGPFLHGSDRQANNQPPHYPTNDASRALHRLSFPFYTREGEAFNHPEHAVLDSGDDNRVWHRLYLEGIIPDGCGIKIWLAATSNREDFGNIRSEHWYEHRFGKRYQQSGKADMPVAVWESIPSELPHHPGLLPCPTQQNISGLFNVLIQRSTRQVRSLKGRFLHVHVQLTGQGRDTPEIFALRAYGSRFSYVDEYLPELYRETVFQPEADLVGGATQADFLNRFVSNFEGVLTNIEDRVAQAQLLTDPMTVPEESLAWIGSWIGYDVNTSFAESIQRQFLQAAPDLYRWHGTLRGLKLALEIATDGAVSGGEIVILEDFRLRRTFASIIGADLVDEDDPLLAGGGVSGNSFVGDTLFIGDENNKEFLALFSADLEVNSSEQSAIDSLFEKLAHRITILVHEEVEPQDLGLINHIASQETPAHIEYRVLSASNRFLVGMSSLVGVDTYLARRRPPGNVRIGRTRLGKNDFIKGPAALDTRLQVEEYVAPDPVQLNPLAHAADVTTGLGADITLDGSASRAFGGRHLTQFNWQYKGRGD